MTTIDVAEPVPMVADTLVVAPRLVRAPAAVVEPVPPLARGTAVTKERSPAPLVERTAPAAPSAQLPK